MHFQRDSVVGADRGGDGAGSLVRLGRADSRGGAGVTAAPPGQYQLSPESHREQLQHQPRCGDTYCTHSLTSVQQFISSQCVLYLLCVELNSLYNVLLSPVLVFTLGSVIRNSTHFQQFLIRNLSLNNDTADLLLSSPVNLKEVCNTCQIQHTPL